MTRPNSVGRSRLVRRLLVIGALMAGAYGVGLVAWWGCDAWQWRAFSREREAIKACVTAWGDEPPAHIDPHTWRGVVITLHNLVGNLCFSPSHVSTDEMRRLRAELEAKSREPITVETLDWLWWRLGKTGPHGPRYVTRMQPLWDEAREALQVGGAPPP